MLDAWRLSSNPSLHDFDWQKAEVCLSRAEQLGQRDDETLGRLALARGYAALERLSGGQYSDNAAPRMRTYAYEQFAGAARKMPRSPEPRLALARFYVYHILNVDEAMAEFSAAERLGAALGPREIEQQGDAYRLRAEQELRYDPAAAVADAKRARGFYERITGFDRANEHLRALGKMKPPVKQAKYRKARRWR